MIDETDIDSSRLPQHVAIIMDGNGRWAERRHQPRLFGHKAGADSVRDIVETSRQLGIKILTLYAFSSENWNRPEQEVSGLMSILQSYLQSELLLMQKNGIQLRCLGQLEKLPKKVRGTMSETIEKTAENTDFILNLAISYGARDEIVRAVQMLAAECVNGALAPADISHEHLTNKLYTAGLPDPDLLIRTGGESRISNFLLWQISYAEILFTDVMWPDFRKEVFLNAIREYQSRERRFGRTGAQLRKK